MFCLILLILFVVFLKAQFLGPLKLCLYFASERYFNLRYHNICYHVYAEDTPLYVSLKCKQPLEAISKLNSCLADY